MRLGTRSPNEFIQSLNKKNEEIQKLFVEKITKISQPRTIKVMLGDSTVTEQKTFDPELIRQFYEKILKNLFGWAVQEVSISKNEDLQRIFTKFEIKEGNYLISGHISVQYHVLLFYKPDQRVLDAQKELADVIETTKNQEQKMSDDSDSLVLEKLKEKGYEFQFPSLTEALDAIRKQH